MNRWRRKRTVFRRGKEVGYSSCRPPGFFTEEELRSTPPGTSPVSLFALDEEQTFSPDTQAFTASLRTLLQHVESNLCTEAVSSEAIEDDDDLCPDKIPELAAFLFKTPDDSDDRWLGVTSSANHHLL